MRAALISLGSISSKWTIEAMEKYFDKVDDINLKNIEVNLGSGSIEVLYNGEPLSKYDCIYPKGSFRFAPLLRSIATTLHNTTFMPLKPEAFDIGHDKLLTHLALQRYKIPMPKTYITSTPEAAKKILEKVNYPIIMKFPQGTQGKGVMFADSFASASSMLDALTALRQPFIIQEYVETGGIDIRVIVIGDKVVAAMKRKAVKGEERANIHAGGKGEPYQPDAHTKKIAVQTAKAIGADICAVDILESPKGPLVIEANLSPGLQGITESTKIDIAEKIAKYLYEKTKSRFESGKKVGTSKIFEDLGIKKFGGRVQEIVSNLDFRGDRILLPKLVTDITKFNEKEELSIKSSRGTLVIKKSDIGGEK
jgi:ribosomal protein S6--L-glutamate ligase